MTCAHFQGSCWRPGLRYSAPHGLDLSRSPQPDLTNELTPQDARLKAVAKPPFLRWHLLGGAWTLWGSSPLLWATGLAGSPGVDRGPSHLAWWSSAIQPHRTDIALPQELQVNNARFRRCGARLTRRSFSGRPGSSGRGWWRVSPRAHRPGPTGETRMAVHPGLRATKRREQHAQPGQGQP
jgi:hypothetical protein